jgi:hypothetical protein
MNASVYVYRGGTKNCKQPPKNAVVEEPQFKVFRDKLKRDDTKAICSILESVLELDRLGLIDHKLFTQLALNTSTFVERVNKRKGVGSIAAMDNAFAESMRTCTRCSKEKSIRSFPKLRLNHAGEWIRRATCRECDGIRIKLRRDAMTDEDKRKKNENAKEYYRQNRDRILKARIARYCKDRHESVS